MVLKVSPSYKYIIIYNYFESDLFYRDGLIIKNVSFVKTRKKFDIFKFGEQSL